MKKIFTTIQEFAEGQLLLVNKPYNWTSFDVVGKIRNSFKPLKLKVGHAGTLDPLASGLLIICTGKMTKQIDTFQAQEKEYTGTITLGASTPTYDLESEPVPKKDPADITPELVGEVIVKRFTGAIDQIPPAHSAIKVDGKRVYELARKGKEVKLEPRRITVKVFEITAFRLPVLEFRVVCSTGTYIRSLANDLGAALGCGGYLSSLRRTRIGEYGVDQALTMETAEKYIEEKLAAGS